MRHGTHRDIRDDRCAVARRDRDRERVRPGERLAVVRMRQATRRRCGEHGDKTTLGEAPHPVAEDPRRKAAPDDDHACSLRRICEGRAQDLLEHEIAERAVPVPALEALLRFEQQRTSGRIDSSDSSQSTRERPCPTFPRRSASSKWAMSVSTAGGSSPSAPGGFELRSASSPGKRHRPEAQCRPTSRTCDPSELAVGVHRDGVADRFEERNVGVRVGVRGRRGEIQRLIPSKFGESVRLRLPVQPLLQTTRVHAVTHLSTRRDHAGEAEPASRPPRPPHATPLTRCTPAHLSPRAPRRGRAPLGRRAAGAPTPTPRRRSRASPRPEPAKDRHGAVRRLPDTALPRTEAREHELRDSRLRHVAAPDQAALAERAGERQRARARDQRTVEIEERGPGHASPTTGPSAACGSSLHASR